jgi:hypothetical protein
MPQENTDASRNDSLPEGAAPFLYMQIDQPPGGSGGPDAPTVGDTPDTSGTDDEIPIEEPPTGGGGTETTTEPTTTPIDQPPGGSGG